MIPAVTHVDGTGRVQTVRKEENPLYYRVIAEFGKITGVPVVLNTSLNVRGQPIVCTPNEACDVFEQVDMDALFLGSYLVEKPKDFKPQIKRLAAELD